MRGGIVSAGGETLDGALVAETRLRLGAQSIDRGRRGRGWLLRRALAAADLSGLLVAFVGAEYGFGKWDAGAALFLLVLPGWLVVAVAAGLYDRDGDRVDHSTAEDLPGLFRTLTVGAWLVFIVVRVLGRAHNDTLKLVMFWLFALVAMSFLRAVARAACRHHPLYVQRTAILGCGEAGQLVAQKVATHPEYGLELLGAMEGEELERLAEQREVDRVVVTFPEQDGDELVRLIRKLNSTGVQVDILPRFYEILDPALEVHDLEGIPILSPHPPRLGHATLLLKRTIDVVGSAVGLVLLAPVFALVALAIKLDSRGPVLFRQVRIGADGRPFTILKFRTMVADADERKGDVAHLNKHRGDPRMFKIDGDPRVTRVGRWLRRRSLDELPQLVNVLRGDMSLVGPRPLIPEEHRWVHDWATRRLHLRPGMTGLWQVLGRDSIDFADMVKLDYRYVGSWSLGRDLGLILRTAPFVLWRGNRDS